MTETSPTLEGAPKRRAILLIPGGRRVERFSRRDDLVRNLEGFERRPLTRLSDERVEIGSEPGVRLVPKPVRGEGAASGPELDVFEAYWIDLIPTEGEVGPWRKLGHGFLLLYYWFFNWGSWRAFFLSPYITLAMILGGLLMVLWYIALALLVADTIHKDPSLAEPLQELPLIGLLIGWFLDAADAVARWYWWALIAFVLTIVRPDELVQMARFVKDFFENRPDAAGAGLRDRMRKRVTSVLDGVLQAPYDEIFIVAHSFGTVLVVDVLADWPHSKDFERLRLVTMGSPVAVLRWQSGWLKSDQERLIGRSELARWVDFHADADWLSTAFPGHRERYGDASSRKLLFAGGLLEKFWGRPHGWYYREPAVLEALSAPI